MTAADSRASLPKANANPSAANLMRDCSVSFHARQHTWSGRLSRPPPQCERGVANRRRRPRVTPHSAARLRNGFAVYWIDNEITKILTHSYRASRGSSHY